jgi:hypothetical protein
LSTNIYAQKFNSKQCLNAKFKTSIKNEGKFFGLIKNDLSIDKTECIINVTYKNVLETNWLIDICREPIHIKVSSKGNQSVYKRVEDCTKNQDQDYCTYWGELHETLQDYGLIFAEGERENLQSPHGQTYCTYLLIKRYLEDGYLFSKYDNPKSIFNEVDAPISTPPQAYIAPSEPSIVPVTPSLSNSSILEDTVEEKADELIEDSTKF